MELTAAIEALRALKMPCRVEMHTDSLYLKNGITRWLKGWIKKGWKLSSGKPVKNKDLWQALDTEAARHDINWHWVKAHADNALNNRADALAQASRPA
jgi:ribonuclease HI